MNPGQDSNMEIHRKRNELLLSKSFCKFVANYSLNTNNYNNNRQDDKLKKGLIKKQNTWHIDFTRAMNACVCVCEAEGDGQNLCFSGSVSPPSVHSDTALVSALRCSFP